MEEKTEFRAGTEEMGTPKGDRSIIPASLEVKEIVERLRRDASISGSYYGKLPLEAASLIESLSERVGELEQLLREAEVFCPRDPIQNLIGNRISSALLSKQEERG